MDFRTLITTMTDAACRGDGSAVAACFTPDGVYHDCFYGSFRGAAIKDMVEHFFHRDATAFLWDIHEPVAHGDTGYARYVFSFESKLPEALGRRAIFEGVSICKLRDGLIQSYREVANSAAGLATLGFAPDRLAKILDREAKALMSRDEAKLHCPR
ncbi:MAG: nuclear transport factor 2 family protein [Gammaproteobacteria bacterium]|nr:nuclear transport factor 2 family protein [Gammaproteobacteria bacterium]